MVLKCKYILGFLAAIVCFTGVAGCEASSKGEEGKNGVILESRTDAELQAEAGAGLEETEEESGTTPKWAAKSDFWVDLGFNIGSTPKPRPIW